jgi:LysM repeat protein
MTRETKIGLLVGLAFIIVIGVLLSDHAQSIQQPRPVDPNAIARGVDRGIATPGKPESGEVTKVPPRVDPTGPVVTDENPVLAKDKVLGPVEGSGVAVAGSGTAGNGMGNAGRAEVSVGPSGGGVLPLPPSMAAGNTPGPVGGGSAIGPEVAGGTVLTPVGGAGATPVPTPPTTTTVASKDVKHVAAEGDSIYKMTIKYYGGYTPAREAAIVKANPKMKGRSDLIVVGQEYVIPDLGTGSAVAKGPASAGGAPVVGNGKGAVAGGVAGVKPTPVVAAAVKTYTVKDGDTLSKIASKTGKSIDEIASANKDVLKNAKYLKIGMVLKIPGDKVVTASVQ